MLHLFRTSGLKDVASKFEEGVYYLEMGLLTRVKLICNACEKLPFDDRSVSGVLSTGTYRGWTDPVLTFKEIHRVFEHGGYAYIDDVYFEADWSVTADLYEVERPSSISHCIPHGSIQ